MKCDKRWLYFQDEGKISLYKGNRSIYPFLEDATFEIFQHSTNE